MEVQADGMIYYEFPEIIARRRRDDDHPVRAELPVMQANLHPQAARGGVATTISPGAWLSWR